MEASDTHDIQDITHLAMLRNRSVSLKLLSMRMEFYGNSYSGNDVPIFVSVYLNLFKRPAKFIQ